MQADGRAWSSCWNFCEAGTATNLCFPFSQSVRNGDKTQLTSLQPGRKTIHHLRHIRSVWQIVRCQCVELNTLGSSHKRSRGAGFGSTCHSDLWIQRGKRSANPPDDRAHLEPKPRLEANTLRGGVRSGACNIIGPK